MTVSDTQRLTEIRSLAQNVIDGWRNSVPRDVYLALERIVELATIEKRTDAGAFAFLDNPQDAECDGE